MKKASLSLEEASLSDFPVVTQAKYSQKLNVAEIFFLPNFLSGLRLENIQTQSVINTSQVFSVW